MFFEEAGREHLRDGCVRQELILIFPGIQRSGDRPYGRSPRLCAFLNQPWSASPLLRGWPPWFEAGAAGPFLIAFGLVSDVTQILDRVQQGDPKAGEELLPLVYDELRKLAVA